MYYLRLSEIVLSADLDHMLKELTKYFTSAPSYLVEKFFVTN